VICLVRTATCLLGCSTSVSVRAQVSHLPRTAAPSCSTWALAGVKTFSSARTVLAPLAGPEWRHIGWRRLLSWLPAGDGSGACPRLGVVGDARKAAA